MMSSSSPSRPNDRQTLPIAGRLLLLGVLATSLTACTFESSALIECRSNGCPSGKVCNSFGFCQDPEEVKDTAADLPVQTEDVEPELDPCGSICASGELCCELGLGGFACRGVLDDPENCGDCGVTCASSNCLLGVCVCDLGMQDCNDNPVDGCEADVATDVEHCGNCGNACPERMHCDVGACLCGEEGCRLGESCCEDGASTTCVDLKANRAHCGDCNQPCGQGEICVEGECKCGEGAPCATPEICCNDACVLDTDPSCDCGGAGPCDPTQLCCSGVCTSVDSDAAHCGQCGRACEVAVSQQTCDGGSCVCSSPDEAACSTGCFDLQTNALHCGTCDTVCGQTELCCGGQCGTIGLGASCPGTSCADILAAGQTASGIYWISNGGDSYQVACDMVTDGGGWTLLMKADGSGEFNYDSAHWRTADVLNESDFDLTAGNAKYPSFNTLPLNEVKADFPELPHVMRESLSGQRTALAVFDDEVSLGDLWANWTEAWPKEGGFKRYGFANDPSGCSSRVRWGWVWNNEGCCCITSDAVSGIGTNRGPDIGGWASCCTDPGGREGDYPAFVLMWGR